MCGDCADGFVGVLGPSNEPCYVAGEHCDNGVLDGNETDTDCGGPCAPCDAAGAACTLDTDCLYSWCTVLGVCAVPVKPCPGSNCTFGQGVCSHVDVTGATLASRDCLANDWACSAVCTCRERFDANGSAAGMWYGDDCSLDEVGFAEVVALRNHLLGSLGSATGMQDVTTDSLNQQASSLSSLSADPSQLAGGGELQALGLVGGIASGSEGAGLSGGTGDTVGGTISSLLSSGLLAQTRRPTRRPVLADRRADRRDATFDERPRDRRADVAPTSRSAVGARCGVAGGCSSRRWRTTALARRRSHRPPRSPTARRSPRSPTRSARSRPRSSEERSLAR